MTAPRESSLPLAAPRATALTTTLLGVYYLATMSRDMGFFDAPEIALVAVQGGVGHPIGQPLHTLLGHALVLLTRPLGLPPLVALNALSAVVAALALPALISLADQLSPRGGIAPWARAVTLGAVGAHVSLWEPATRIEVYPLATTLCLYALAFGHRALCTPATRATQRRAATLTGGCIGLATGANVILAALATVALLPWIVSAIRQRALPRRAFGAAVGTGFLSLIVWLYVPLAARDPDVVAWGRPTTPDALLAYLRGDDFRSKAMPTGMTGFAENMLRYAEFSLREGHAALAALGAAGFALVARRALLPYLVMLGGALVWYGRYAGYAPGILDHFGYLAGGYSLAAVGLLFSAERLERALFRRVSIDDVGEATRGGESTWGLRATLLRAAVIATVVMFAAPAPGTRTRSADRVTRSLALATLQDLPDGAILIVEADHFAAPLLYLQEIEAARPDVVVLLFGLTASSWYWDLLERRHPGLASFERRGPGRREGRVRRFLAAQEGRPIFVAEAGIGPRLGLPLCAVACCSRPRAVRALRPIGSRPGFARRTRRCRTGRRGHPVCSPRSRSLAPKPWQRRGELGRPLRS